MPEQEDSAHAGRGELKMKVREILSRGKTPQREAACVGGEWHVSGAHMKDGDTLLRC